MVKISKSLKMHYIISFWASLIVAAGLMITGFFIPPKGQIDPSILQATGIIFLWPALGFGAKALEEGNIAKIKKGDTTIQIGAVEGDDEDNV